MILETILRDNLKRARIKANLPLPKLVEVSLCRNEGTLTDRGALSVLTGKYTGRSPKDKFFVLEPSSEKDINWGPINKPMKPSHYEQLHKDVLEYLSEKELYVFDGYAGADPNYRQSLRVINEFAWQNIFIGQLLLRPTPEDLGNFIPDYHIISAPGFQADPQKHGTNSEAVIAINLAEKTVIIAGTSYAGEMKKSVFTLMNYILPKKGVLPMHCSANTGKQGDVALFFGLSGTGKTTLSADPDRHLIGDDEHGWCDSGVFNIEGGCYAKCIDLNPQDEPQIWNALRFGSILENVVLDERNTPDFSSPKYTENTRSAYPVDFIPNPIISGIGEHPQVIFFLTADAFGILPPISRLDKNQAMYHFLSGYTSKLAGTERGIIDPEATFSACFGAPFLPFSPVVYANLLGERIDKHGTKVYLINTGWTGGPYGTGHRFKLAHTRAIIRAALQGQLDSVDYWKDPLFGFEIPKRCPGVPEEVLNPQTTWNDPAKYEISALNLAQRFVKNFSEFENIPQNILNASPRI